MNPPLPKGEQHVSPGRIPGDTVGQALCLLAWLMLLYQATLDWFGCYKKLDLAGQPSFKKATLVKGFFAPLSQLSRRCHQRPAER